MINVEKTPKKLFKLLRGPSESFMIKVILLGIFMLLQPFFMAIFTYSFAVILFGTLGFVVVSHFPEE